MRPSTTIDAEQAAVIALGALGWTLDEASRAERLLTLTGLTPDDLRHRVGEASVQAAILGFLAGHEPDLVACADALHRRPEDLIAAHRVLEAA